MINDNFYHYPIPQIKQERAKYSGGVRPIQDDIGAQSGSSDADTGKDTASPGTIQSPVEPIVIQPITSPHRVSIPNSKRVIVATGDLSKVVQQSRGVAKPESPKEFHVGNLVSHLQAVTDVALTDGPKRSAPSMSRSDQEKEPPMKVLKSMQTDPLSDVSKVVVDSDMEVSESAVTTAPGVGGALLTTTSALQQQSVTTNAFPSLPLPLKLPGAPVPSVGGIALDSFVGIPRRMSIKPHSFTHFLSSLQQIPDQDKNKSAPPKLEKVELGTGIPPVVTSLPQPSLVGEPPVVHLPFAASGLMKRQETIPPAPLHLNLPQTAVSGPATAPPTVPSVSSDPGQAPLPETQKHVLSSKLPTVIPNYNLGGYGRHGASPLSVPNVASSPATPIPAMVQQMSDNGNLSNKDPTSKQRPKRAHKVSTLLEARRSQPEKTATGDTAVSTPTSEVAVSHGGSGLVPHSPVVSTPIAIPQWPVQTTDAIQPFTTTVLPLSMQNALAALPIPARSSIVNPVHSERRSAAAEGILMLAQQSCSQSAPTTPVPVTHQPPLHRPTGVALQEGQPVAPLLNAQQPPVEGLQKQQPMTPIQSLPTGEPLALVVPTARPDTACVAVEVSDTKDEHWNPVTDMMSRISEKINKLRDAGRLPDRDLGTLLFSHGKTLAVTLGGVKRPVYILYVGTVCICNICIMRIIRAVIPTLVTLGP